MVAALSCNQETAYNTFVERFRPLLVSAGRSVSSYFVRTGGGERALNTHITALANAAGLARAQNPEDYCHQTWSMFLLLEEQPLDLPVVAAKHMTPGIAQPKACEPAVPATTEDPRPAGTVYKTVVQAP